MQKHIAVLIALFACCLFVATTTAAFNSQDYCGVYPYPEEIPAIPLISTELQQKYRPQLIDSYTTTRHGDRSTIISNCFANTPQGNRNWTICPHGTVQWHSGLEERSKYLPAYPFPFQPAQDKQILLGNCHFGQLSQKGLMMSYNNGVRMGKFLNQSYAQTTHRITQDNLELRTTDVLRTRETAMGWVTGVLDNLWNVDPSKLPTIAFVDDKVDAFKLGSNMCKTQPYLDEAYGTAEYQKFQKEFVDPLTEKLKTLLNDPKANVNDVFDCVKTSYCHGVPLPDGLEELHADLEKAANYYWQYAFNYDHKRSSQLFTGPTSIELSQMFAKSALKTVKDKPTIRLISGHDFGPQMNLLSTLISGEHLFWPPYSAMINVEFYNTAVAIDGETAFVRVLWVGEVVEPHFCKGKMVGGELCPTSVLLDFMKTVLPTKDQCPGYPRYDWPTLSAEVINTPAMQRVKQQQPKLAQSIEALYNELTALHYTAYGQQDINQWLQEQLEYREPTHAERWAQFAN